MGLDQFGAGLAPLPRVQLALYQAVDGGVVPPQPVCGHTQRGQQQPSLRTLTTVTYEHVCMSSKTNQYPSVKLAVTPFPPKQRLHCLLLYYYLVTFQREISWLQNIMYAMSKQLVLEVACCRFWTNSSLRNLVNNNKNTIY